MATLKSTLSIRGIVNGRSVNIEHTFTLEDVYDAGYHAREFGNQQSLITGNTSGGDPVTFTQDTPQYLLAVNRETYGVDALRLSGTTMVDIDFLMPPNAIMCIGGTQGIAYAGTSATSISLASLDTLLLQPLSQLPPGRTSILVAYVGTT
jgi:hypothetical protein